MASLVVAALATGVAIRDDRSDGGGLDGEAAVDAYRIVYRVESYDSSGTTVTWEELVVRRPFEGLIAGYLQRPSTETVPQGGSLSTATGIFVLNDAGKVTQVAGRVPAAGMGDLRLQFDDLRRSEVLVDQGGDDWVVGRECRVYRTREPLSLSMARGTASDHDDLCIDRAGRVLRERWYTDGDLLMVREAVEVDDTPDDDAFRLFALAEQASSSPPSARRVSGDVDTFVEHPPAPAGYRQLGTFEYAPDPRVAFAGGGVFQSVSWVFVRDNDFVVVEAGQGQTPFDLDEGVSVEGGEVGALQVLATPGGTEIRVDAGVDGWIRVSGTASAAWLTEYVRSLRLAR